MVNMQALRHSATISFLRFRFLNLNHDCCFNQGMNLYELRNIKRIDALTLISMSPIVSSLPLDSFRGYGNIILL